MPKISQVMSRAEQAMSIKYNTMVYELRQQGIDVLVMSFGEAYFDVPSFPIDDLPKDTINHYSHSRGLPTLRDQLADYFASEYGVGFDPAENIIITAGSKAAIYMTLMSILDPGDEVVYTEPAWVSYPEQIKLCYGVPIGVPCTRGIAGIAEYITSRTRAVIITNPNNPSGYVYTTEELQQLVDLARERDLWLLADEAYSDFAPEGAFVSLGSLDPDWERVVIFNSMSKNFGISGWRIGYVIANSELIANILKANQHLITCPATILEYYLAKHFDAIIEVTRPQMRALLETRTALSNHMQEIGLLRLEGDATFYFFVSIGRSSLGSEAFCDRLLNERHISAVPGVGYGNSCDRYIRVSFGTATLEENMRGLNEIKELIEQTS